MSSQKAELIFDAKAVLGEGSLWHAQTQILYWVDILGQHFWRFDPATNKQEKFEIGQYVGTIVPRRRGGVMLALHHGLAEYDLVAKKLTMLADPEDNKPAVRFNDGKCDPAGRFWAGTMPVEGGDPIGHLYCMHADKRVETKLDGIGCSNGIVWSHDRRQMYYIDTGLMRVDAFDYDNDTGHISNRRIAFPVLKEHGYPDGSTIDAEGMLWIAHFGGACVTRWNPKTGKHLATFSLPTSNITSCAFGGPKLDRLYVTSASVALSPEKKAAQPHAGGLFCLDVGVQGVEAFEFAG